MLLERLKKILGWEFSHTRGSSSFQFVHEAGRGRSFLVLHSLLSSTTIIRRDCVAEELIHERDFVERCGELSGPYLPGPWASLPGRYMTLTEEAKSELPSYVSLLVSPGTCCDQFGGQP